MTTWTPKTKQAEVWTEETSPTRVFDPDVFDRNPIFDTGSPAGAWSLRAKQAETWTAE